METLELPIPLPDIERHFKITAGPGAGKTTWLAGRDGQIGHIQHVINTSTRLGKVKKIGCITYTNIAAETISTKLKKTNIENFCDVSTIHSFLYRNVVKPFAFLIPKEYGITDLSGHDEHKPSKDRIESWVSNDISIRYLTSNETDDDNWANIDKTFYYLNKLDWNLENDKIKPIFRVKFYPQFVVKTKKETKTYSFPTKKILEYKKTYWRYNIIHHEDVLFFTYQIFKIAPKIIEFVTNKFPYIFIDEFQDTTPLQSWIIKKLAETGTIIGVIGDPAQSIYRFAGAKRSDFDLFTLPDIIKYKLSSNHRSTQEIVDFLNTFRQDIQQTKTNESFKSVKLLTGSFEEIKNKVTTQFELNKKNSDAKIGILARNNNSVQELKFGVSHIEYDLVSELFTNDKDYKRCYFITALAKSVMLLLENKRNKALKEIEKYVRRNKSGIIIPDLIRRKLIIEIIEHAQSHKENEIHTIFNFLHNKLKTDYQIETIGSGLRQPKDIHKKKLIELFPFIRTETLTTDEIRTIHKSKGDEFDTVLVCIYDKQNKDRSIKKSANKILEDYIINSVNLIDQDGDNGEETRTYYVALSRAQRQLFIGIETINESLKIKLDKICIKYE
jgi:DNA helicase-2/ATP-dependent DNA helicase PcrA